MRNFLKDQLKEIPYFRATLRSVEASYYQSLDLAAPTLDVGCGDGHFASHAFTQTINVGIDPWRKPLREAAQLHGYEMLVQGEGNKFPFTDKWFGSVFSNSVLEHIDDVDEVLREVFRVMRPGAHFYFCVPNDGYLKSLSLSHVLGGGYKRWFKQITRVYHADNPRIWRERMENAGFVLERTWNYFSPAAMRMLEWGHYFGLPALIIKWVTGRWILVSADWNIHFTESLVRKYTSPEPIENGVFTFFIAKKK